MFMVTKGGMGVVYLLKNLIREIILHVRISVDNVLQSRFTNQGFYTLIDFGNTARPNKANLADCSSKV